MRWHLLVRDENCWNTPSVTSVGTQVHLSGSVKMSKAVSSRNSLRGGVSDRHSSSGSVGTVGESFRHEILRLMGIEGVFLMQTTGLTRVESSGRNSSAGA